MEFSLLAPLPFRSTPIEESRLARNIQTYLAAHFYDRGASKADCRMHPIGWRMTGSADKAVYVVLQGRQPPRVRGSGRGRLRDCAAFTSWRMTGSAVKAVYVVLQGR